MRKSMERILPKRPPPRLEAKLFETFGEKKVSLKMFDDSIMMNSSRAATTFLTRTPKTNAKQDGFFDDTKNDSDRTEKLSFDQEREASLENHRNDEKK
jgi:hypothetical protein